MKHPHIFSPNSADASLLPVALPMPILSPPLVSPPLQVYSRQSHPSPHNNNNFLPHIGAMAIPSDSSFVPLSPTPIMPVAKVATPTLTFRKGIHSSHNPHLIYNFFSYHHLSSSDYAFVSSALFLFPRLLKNPWTI